MDAEHVQRIVDAELVDQFHCNKAGSARSGADNDGRHHAHKSCRPAFIATNPATAPAAAPLADGRRVINQEMMDHEDMAVAAATLVTTKALARGRGRKVKTAPGVEPEPPEP